MSDPAIEAAQRAWASITDDNKMSPKVVVETAAREALAPLRKLHCKSPIYNLAEDCDICSSDDEQVQEQHALSESAYGDYLCTAEVLGYTCAYCSEIRDPSQDLSEWPCETATYLYSTEELGFDS